MNFWKIPSKLIWSLDRIRVHLHSIVNHCRLVKLYFFSWARFDVSLEVDFPLEEINHRMWNISWSESYNFVPDPCDCLKFLKYWESESECKIQGSQKTKIEVLYCSSIMWLSQLLFCIVIILSFISILSIFEFKLLRYLMMKERLSCASWKSDLGEKMCCLINKKFSLKKSYMSWVLNSWNSTLVVVGSDGQRVLLQIQVRGESSFNISLNSGWIVLFLIFSRSWWTNTV